MPRLCSVCSHPQRAEVDLALAQHAEGYRNIAQRFGVGAWALYRHEREHLRTSLMQRRDIQAMLSANNLLAKLSALDDRTLGLLVKAEKQGDLRTALLAVRESRGNVESYARLGVESAIEGRLSALEELLHGAPPQAEGEEG